MSNYDSNMKPIHLREADFKREVSKYTFPEGMKKEFIEYWTEPNKSGTKMRYELEKTWHLSRRLSRWANNGFGKKEVTITPKKEMKEPVTEIERLDALLNAYKAKFESVPFEEFGKWYDYLKKERLMRQFSKEDIEIIKESYKDNSKCRCAAVKMTFDAYINTSLTFGHIIEMRERLCGKT